MSDATLGNERVTERLAEHVLAVRHGELPDDARKLARQCILDWFAVTLAGSTEPLTRILAEDAAEQGGTADCTLVGLRQRASTRQAALINGASSHALDYDDVNFHLGGHPTVTLVPAILALAEQRGSSGADVIAAFVAGYEMGARVGALVRPSHYERGFHATATIGCFAAAAGAAHLLRLDRRMAQTAFGIAATRAAGLKSMFGTMCKPLHAGMASESGLFAALLAAKGFTSRQDAIECEQGFAQTHADRLKIEAALEPPAAGLHIRNNLFKYHAACYLTHAPIECARKLKDAHGLKPGDIARIRLKLDKAADKVCNIARPTTGLEAKFSLRQTVAFALAGVDTAALGTYSDAMAQDPRFFGLRDKVEIEFAADWDHAFAEMAIETTDGRRFESKHDAGVPADDIERQDRVIGAKFLSLAEPVLGKAGAASLGELVARLDTLPNLRALGAALVPAAH
jgi:2-methylcitrate dehydratase PrpD